MRARLWIIFLLLSPAVRAQDTMNEDIGSTKLKLMPLIGYDFGSKGGWANLNPEIFLGFDTCLASDSPGAHSLRMRLGPTISSGFDRIDSSNYFRSIMMPGPVGISMLLYNYNNLIGPGLKLVTIAGAGLKIIGQSADRNSITQNNLKLGGGFQLMNIFMVTVDHTWGWHAFTDESERGFRSTFHSNATAVRYLTVTLEGYSPGVSMYFFLCWRKFLSTEYISELIQGETKVISIGLRKNLELGGQAR